MGPMILRSLSSLSIALLVWLPPRRLGRAEGRPAGPACAQGASVLAQAVRAHQSGRSQRPSTPTSAI